MFYGSKYLPSETSLRHSHVFANTTYTSKSSKPQRAHIPCCYAPQWRSANEAQYGNDGVCRCRPRFPRDPHIPHIKDNSQVKYVYLKQSAIKTERDRVCTIQSSLITTSAAVNHVVVLSRLVIIHARATSVLVGKVVLGIGRFLDLSHLLRSFFTAHTLKLFKFSVFGDLALFFSFRSLFLFSRSITYGTWLVNGMGYGRCLIEKYSRSLERDDMWRSFHAFSTNHVYEKMKIRQQLSSSPYYMLCTYGQEGVLRERWACFNILE